MNEKNKWYNVLEAEKETKIPDATIRRYIRNHGHHLNIRKRGKSYLIAHDSLSIINKIRELYDDGKQLHDVEDTLRMMNVPMNMTVDDGEKGVTVTVSETLIQLQKGITEANKYMAEQMEFNQSLLEAIKKQQDYIDTRMKERDQNLMQSLKESTEARKEIASASEEKKGSIWSRMFNRR
ncbi:DUF3967 domain-containing protein [Jeotgalibacillus marinus]|uniref:DUF3967 domain-containing protein n=1 Tax=Jeotgalibacillus marinus TaxID=86667 RepID=A0ABV3Q3L6_9BACL